MKGARATVRLIAGPTAGGKTALALDIAEAIGGEIVNADSMQIYADLRILTARPSRRDEMRAPHHLFGVADAADAWSVGRWLTAAAAVLREIAARGQTAIIVGGTGLYFRALTEGLADIPPVSPAVRAFIAALYEDLGEAAFRARLARVDLASATRISSGDRQRLTRAFEVHAATGRGLSDWRSAVGAPLAAADWRGVILDPPRADLYARCNARLSSMFDEGVHQEVAVLAARNLDPDLPAMKALGVAPISAFLRGEISREEALARSQGDTRRYVKRQSTWFRHQTPDWPRLTGRRATLSQEAPDFMHQLGYDPS